MAQSLRDIISNIKQVSMSDNSLETLMDFERVLDEMNLYAFKNWKIGELIAGPDIKKYRISCTFMWPYHLMPDPAGAERLLNFGVEVKWGRDHLVYPIQIKSESDFREGTKKPKLAKKNIWIVTFDIPKHLIKDIRRGSIDVLNREMDLEDLDQAYEKDLDQQGVNGDQTQEQITDDMQDSQGMDEMGGM